MSTVPPTSSSSSIHHHHHHHHHDPTCTSFFTLLLQSRFPSLKRKPRFSDFIEPAADNNESKNIDFNDHTPPPGSSSTISKISFVIGAVASALTISPASAPHMRSWGLVLLVHFCGLFVSRCIAGLIFFGIQKPLLPFGVRYLSLSAKTAARATGWVLLLLLFNILVVGWVFDGIPALRFFQSLRTLMYLFTAGQTTFYVFQSLFLRRKFFSWMKQTASHLYMLNSLMGPPRCKKSKPKAAEAEEDPARLFSSMIVAAFCTDSPLVDVVDTVLFCADALLMIVAESMQLTSVPVRMNSLLRVAGDRKLLADIDGSAKSKFKVNSQMKIQKEARQAFRRINSAGHKFIKREDMLRFLTEDDVDMAFLLVMKTYGTTKIDELAFQEWVVETYRRRKSLVHAIIDTKRIMSILNRFAMTSIMAIFLLSSLVKGMATTTALVSLVPQLYLLGYAFRNNIQNILDSILFVFVAHPFDVGDCCMIDGAQMIVEEMNITNTVFLRFDHEKICYSNSELLAKTIINYNQNPSIGEKIEFLVDISTPEETVVELRKRVEAYLKGKPEHWQAKHSIVMKGTTEERKMKMNLHVVHKMNYHNFFEMNKHKSDLLIALKEIFESLGIKNYAFPGSSPSPKCPGNREDTTISCSSNKPSVISPNAELLARPIDKDSRKGEKIEFLVDVCTPGETLKKLRKLVPEQLGKLTNWQRKPSLSIKGIAEGNIKMNLHVVPKTNYQNSPETSKLRSDLLFALKKVIEGVGIKNYEIPREVSHAPCVHGCWEDTVSFSTQYLSTKLVSGPTCEPGTHTLSEPIKSNKDYFTSEKMNIICWVCGSLLLVALEYVCACGSTRLK